MSSINKEFIGLETKDFEKEDVVTDITKTDHLMLFLIGILPLVIVSIWYSITI